MSLPGGVDPGPQLSGNGFEVSMALVAVFPLKDCQTGSYTFPWFA